MESLSIRPLSANDITDVVAAFENLGWNKPRSQYEKYLLEQNQGTRSIFIARSNGQFAGYCTIVWRSVHAYFEQRNIPEIKDLNVLPNSRKQGIGMALMVACENAARARKCEIIGLGVGLLADYGSAQRLYVKMGYMPDGTGLHYGIQTVVYGEKVSADDDLVLYLSKNL